jgi:sulfite reductase alpha subunit-like flavoprotein
VRYQPGDTIAIAFQNDEAKVAAILARLKLDPTTVFAIESTLPGGLGGTRAFYGFNFRSAVVPSLGSLSVYLCRVCVAI